MSALKQNLKFYISYLKELVENIEDKENVVKQLMAELPEKHTVIAGHKPEKPIRDIERLVARHGGEPEDWLKIVSRHVKKGNENIGVHAYFNKKTKEIVNMKTKINPKATTRNIEKIKKIMPDYAERIGKIII